MSSVPALALAAIALLHASACAPPCDGAGDIVEVDEAFIGFSAEAVVADARVDGGRMLVDIRDAEDATKSFTLSFALADDSEPAVPPAGAPVRIGAANCYGEGCEDTWFAVDDFFEVGQVALLEDDESTLRPTGARIGVTSDVTGADVCDDGDGKTEPAAATVTTDGGVEVIAPGVAKVVSIAGRDWQALGGSAARTSSFGFVAVTDGPGPGFSSTTSATAVLYLLATQQ